MADTTLYDVAIVGGGLAGLAAAIQLSRQGHSVLVLEKEQYPFHKVCGEYVSMESWNFLTALGLDLHAMQLPIISRLQLSTVKGKMIEQPLPLGGFGISRYALDHQLAIIARKSGVVLLENTKVGDIVFQRDLFIVTTGNQQFQSRVACSSAGKRSNLDIKWKRPFTVSAKNRLNNYIGVKYHAILDFPVDTIALHHFNNGYCGIVKIEGNRYNICYLTTAENLRQCNGQISDLERQVLLKNPRLKELFSHCQFLFEAPLTISQISFDDKNQVEEHVLMLGDAAGMITPLCGNGMSMALHGSKIAAGQIHQFLERNCSREEMESSYTKLWRKQFGRRLKTGRRIQRLFTNNKATSLSLRLLRFFPGALRYLVKQTHGKPF